MMSRSLFSYSAASRFLGCVVSMWLLPIAQALSANGLPEALKDIKQATGMCMRDDVSGAKSAIGATVAELPPDLSCAMTPAELSAHIGRPDTALIDTRLAPEHAAVRIDDSLNMSVSELRAKPFLRAKTVVLIGSGKAERELYAACAALKADGFKQVKVLRGGMPSWLLGRQAVLGKPLDAMQSPRLSPSELWGESQFDANLVLLARSQGGMQQQLPSARLLPEESPAAIKSMIEQRRRKGSKNAPLAAVILVTAAGATPETVQRLREAAQPIPLLVYADTQDAYARQLTLQKAIWTAQAHGPKQLGCGL